MRQRARLTLLTGLLFVGHPASAQPPASAPVAAADRVRRLVERGDLRRAAGDAISALGYYRDAIGAGPRRSEGYVALGACYLALGEPLRALEVYDAAARAQVFAEPLVIAHAATLMQLDQSARALALLRRLVQSEPASRAGLAALADLSESRGAFIEALSARRALLALIVGAPDSAPTEVRDARTRVRALERLLGGAERVRSPTRCENGASAVTLALARCTF